jgi:hypothetical protein
MMCCKNALLLMGLGALACSGRYEVGEMDPAGGSGGSTATAGSSATGDTGWLIGGSNAVGGSYAVGGSNAVGGSAAIGGSAASDCFKAVAPAPLNAPFVSPQQVWVRVAPFIWWEEVPVEKPGLPSEMSYDGAGELVDDAFAEVIAETGGVPGATFFVRHWLGLETSEGTLEGDYAAAMAPDDTTLLEALLLTRWAPDRIGAFSEPTWLALKPSIPRRGHDMALNLFGVLVPPPPPSIDLTMVDSTLQDRAAIEAATSSAPCASCHRMFTPLGYSLGHFDRAGDYRERDHNLPIDVSGVYEVPNGTSVLTFDGIAELGEKAATTCDANVAIVDRFLDVALTVRGYDLDSRVAAVQANRERVRRAFTARGRSYHALLRAFAQSPLVLY